MVNGSIKNKTKSAAIDIVASNQPNNLQQQQRRKQQNVANDQRLNSCGPPQNSIKTTTSTAYQKHPFFTTNDGSSTTANTNHRGMIKIGKNQQQSVGQSPKMPIAQMNYNRRQLTNETDQSLEQFKFFEKSTNGGTPVLLQNSLTGTSTSNISTVKQSKILLTATIPTNQSRTSNMKTLSRSHVTSAHNPVKIPISQQTMNQHDSYKHSGVVDQNELTAQWKLLASQTGKKQTFGPTVELQSTDKSRKNNNRGGPIAKLNQSSIKVQQTMLNCFTNTSPVENTHSQNNKNFAPNKSRKQSGQSRLMGIGDTIEMIGMNSASSKKTQQQINLLQNQKAHPVYQTITKTGDSSHHHLLNGKAQGQLTQKVSPNMVMISSSPNTTSTMNSQRQGSSTAFKSQQQNVSKHRDNNQSASYSSSSQNHYTQITTKAASLKQTQYNPLVQQQMSQQPPLTTQNGIPMFIQRYSQQPWIGLSTSTATNSSVIIDQQPKKNSLIGVPDTSINKTINHENSITLPQITLPISDQATTMTAKRGQPVYIKTSQKGAIISQTPENNLKGSQKVIDKLASNCLIEIEQNPSPQPHMTINRNQSFQEQYTGDQQSHISIITGHMGGSQTSRQTTVQAVPNKLIDHQQYSDLNHNRQNKQITHQSITGGQAAVSGSYVIEPEDERSNTPCEDKRQTATFYNPIDSSEITKNIRAVGNNYHPQTESKKGKGTNFTGLYSPNEDTSNVDHQVLDLQTSHIVEYEQRNSQQSLYHTSSSINDPKQIQQKVLGFSRQGLQQAACRQQEDQVSQFQREGDNDDISSNTPNIIGQQQEINFFEAYDFKDDGPEEEDDEVQVDDGISEEEGEEELHDDDDTCNITQKDLSLSKSAGVDGKDKNLFYATSTGNRDPIMRGSASPDKRPSTIKAQGTRGNKGAAKDVNCRTQLYEGDIYLMGGSHFIMNDQVKNIEPKKFSQASTTSESELPPKSFKRRGNTRSRKRTKVSKQCSSKLPAPTLIQEADEDETAASIGTGGGGIVPQDVGVSVTTINKLQTSSQNMTELTDKQKKQAARDVFLRRPPNQIVTMIKSPFVTREPYIFFPYPPFVGGQRSLPKDYSKIIQYRQDEINPSCIPGFKVSDSTHTYNCVVNALKMAGFRHVTGAAWNVIWTGLFKTGRLRNMNQLQHINHFAGSQTIGNKAFMWRNVQRMRRLHGKAFDIAPSTYVLPEDYKRWMNDREASNFKNMYILKPNAASCGKGIRVIGKKQAVSKRSGYIVSKYVSKPHLIRGYKYDLRLYVLVTSFDPIKIYLFRDGLVRLATVQYSTSKSSLKQRFVHLTNYSVNKKADSYIKNTNSKTADKNETKSKQEEGGENEEEETVESKLSFQQLRNEYQKMGVDYNEIFAGIKDLIIKTCFAAEQPILQCIGGTKNRNACFEIYGFDVLIDAKLRPWLLEVNVSPSLSSSSPLDKQIKTTLISDTLYLIGLRLIDRKQQELERVKQNKQRLLGFDSKKQKKNHDNSSDQMMIAYAAEDKTTFQERKQSASRTRQPTHSNSGGINQQMKSSSFNPFPQKQNDTNIGGAKTMVPNRASKTPKTSSPNRKRQNLTSQQQQPKPWFKDLGEPALSRNITNTTTSHSQLIQLSSQPQNIMGGIGMNNGNVSQAVHHQPVSFPEGYVNLSDIDLDTLADFEEESLRRGHFELLFPVSKNIDNYRGFLQSNRRANLVLWAYLKQGAPIHHLVNQFKHKKSLMHTLQMQQQQQQQATAAANNPNGYNNNLQNGKKQQHLLIQGASSSSVGLNY